MKVAGLVAGAASALHRTGVQAQLLQDRLKHAWLVLHACWRHARGAECPNALARWHCTAVHPVTRRPQLARLERGMDGTLV
jgi:hypothetical protein